MPITLNKRAVFISNEEVISVSDMESYIEVVERAYANYGEKKSVNFQRQSLWVEVENQPKRSLKLMAAATPTENAFGGYIYSGGYRHQRGWQKCLILYDFTQGDLRAIIESEHMSWLKTGAVSAVAAKYLSRENAKTVSLFGAGKKPGREKPTEITVFKSGGKGFEYMALGSYVYEKIIRKSSF
jgi:ornithine cyclodeaminase